jgi:hypothetical protein
MYIHTYEYILYIRYMICKRKDSVHSKELLYCSGGHVTFIKVAALLYFHCW